MKLVLQAFMLSLSCCMEHPSASMLRQQMLARLMAVACGAGGAGGGASTAAASRWLKEWYERQSSGMAADELIAAGGVNGARGPGRWDCGADVCVVKVVFVC